MISDLYVGFRTTGEGQYADLLIRILREMQEEITPGKGGDKNSNHKDLAGA